MRGKACGILNLGRGERGYPSLILGDRRPASAADLKSVTHSLQNRVQGLQIESGTRIIDLLVPMTFRSPRKAMERGLRKVGTRRRATRKGGIPSGSLVYLGV